MDALHGWNCMNCHEIVPLLMLQHHSFPGSLYKMYRLNKKQKPVIKLIGLKFT